MVSILIIAFLSVLAATLGIIAVQVGLARRHKRGIEASLRLYEKDGAKATPVIQAIMDASMRGATADTYGLPQALGRAATQRARSPRRRQQQADLPLREPGPEAIRDQPA